MNMADTDIDNNGFFEEKKPNFKAGDKIRFSQKYRVRGEKVVRI